MDGLLAEELRSRWLEHAYDAEAEVQVVVVKENSSEAKRSSLLRRSLSLARRSRKSASNSKSLAGSALSKYMELDNEEKVSFRPPFVPQGEAVVDVEGAETLLAILTTKGDKVYLVDEEGDAALRPGLNANEKVVEIRCAGKEVGMLTSEGRVMVGSRLSPPAMVEFGKSEPAVQISSTETCLFILGLYGRVFVIGAGGEGVLGLGPKVSESKVATQLEGSLRYAPAVQLSCGPNHCLARLASGAVVGWGANKEGQLGLAKRNTVPWPVPLPFENTVSIACGNSFSAILQEDGTVIIASKDGTKGLPHTNHGDKVIHLSSFHSCLVLIFKSGQTQVISPITNSKFQTVDIPNRSILRAFGVDGFVFLLHSRGKAKKRISTWVRHHTVLSANEIARYLRDDSSEGAGKSGIVEELEFKLELMSTDPYALASAFADLSLDSISKIDFVGAREYLGRVFQKISSADRGTVFRQQLGGHLNELAMELKGRVETVSVVDELRAALVLLLTPLHSVAPQMSFELLLTLRKTPAKSKEWLESVFIHDVNSALFTECLLNPVMRAITTELEIRNGADQSANLVDCLEFVSWIHALNGKRTIAQRVHFQMFALDCIPRMTDVTMLLSIFDSSFPVFGLMPRFPIHAKNHPFLIPTETKIGMFKLQRARIVATRFGNPPMTYVIRVRRTALLKDFLRQLSRASGDQLSRPLVVMFEGEEGLDVGGVRKEFFDTLSYQLFHPSLGVFSLNKETGMMWFDSSRPSSERGSATTIITMVGQLIGLAALNNCILDIAFPELFYELLLPKEKKDFTLSDLEQVDPALVSGLRDLLAYNGEDMEDVFSLNFEVGTSGKELVPGGKDIGVTQENKHEYVSLVTKHYLVDSIESESNALRSGFRSVVDSTFTTLGLLCPEELELLVAGNPTVDMGLLQTSTTYEGGYHGMHPTIRMFWEVVSNWTNDQQRELLRFATGAPRVPAGSLASFRFKIQRAGVDSEQLPSASTCFNTLLLPDYSSKEKLERKLLQAIENSKGFFLQ